jgi:hypothetical protein
MIHQKSLSLPNLYHLNVLYNLNNKMTKKFTESIAFLDQLKNQLDKDVPQKEPKSVDVRGYGSIKRSYAGQGQMTPYVPTYVPRANRGYEECDIR